MANEGEQALTVLTEEGAMADMTFQITDVRRPLCSVGKICDADKYVVFGAKGGHIKARWSSNKMFFQRENGVCVLRTWIPVDKSASSASGFARQG